MLEKLAGEAASLSPVGPSVCEAPPSSSMLVERASGLSKHPKARRNADRRESDIGVTKGFGEASDTTDCGLVDISDRADGRLVTDGGLVDISDGVALVDISDGVESN
mmetsp:Transcript_57037/g.107152  ORF Transcript_57037/g.107152 Transcript_57037/m.107152 type:complete len:107 (-) Transcript_57037:41-361(-)